MALIALRLLIGWHLFKEGTSKLQGAPYSSGALFQNSKGPLAPLFRRVVWDPYGMARLDRKRTESIWAKYRNSLKASTGDDKTKKEFDRVEAARAPGRRLVATIRHLVNRHGATLVVVSPRDDSARSRILASWTDLEVGSFCDGGVVERVA